MRRSVAVIPAIVLIVVLALLPLQAWVRSTAPDVRYDQPNSELVGITWAGTVAANGRVAVEITFDFGDTATREVNLRLPRGARFARVNGAPLAADLGTYATTTVTGPLTLNYERLGAVTRYDDGVLVDLTGVTQGGSYDDDALFACAFCYLLDEGYGNTSIVGALYVDDTTNARIALSGVTQLISKPDAPSGPGALRFISEVPQADSVGLLAWLPVDAAPNAPRAPGVAAALDFTETPSNDVESDRPPITGDSAAAVWEATRTMAKSADVALHEASTAPPISRIASATALSVMWALLVVWIILRLAAARRRLAAVAPDAPVARDAVFMPPSTLDPALVGAIVGDIGRGKRSGVAATLLALAHRGVIRIDGIDSVHYTLTVPPGARGANRFEELVLNALRPQGQLTATATLTGPPLWGPSGPSIASSFQHLADSEIRRTRLVASTLTATVLFPMSFAMGLVAVIATGGSDWLSWVLMFAGPVVALATTSMTGTSLTAKGRAERHQWLAYAHWLRANSQLESVGAPAIATWGEPLIYAAAVGAAPTAAAALAPD